MGDRSILIKPMAITPLDMIKNQDRLYENLKLLNLIHPPSKEFLSVCKNRMFAKSNKAAFHHVVYYLLKLLYPSNIKVILPSWPILEIRMEVPFRNEVFKAINELWNIYKEADIPPMMASHFVSPGGPKFVKFMYKLSQLALVVSIQGSCDPRVEYDNFVGKLQPIESKDCPSLDCRGQYKKNVEALKRVNKFKEHECAQLKNKFDEYLKRCQDKENEMLAEERTLKIDMPRLKSKIKLENSHATKRSLEEIILEVDILKINVAESNSIHELSDEGGKLLKYLLDKSSRLEYNPDKFTVPQEVEHIIKSGVGKLNLLDLFTAFEKYLQNRRFEVKEALSEEVRPVCEKFVVTLRDLNAVSGSLDQLKKQFDVSLLNLNNYDDAIFKKCNIKIIIEDVDSSNSMLAVPLENTP